jgi:F-box-like
MDATFASASREDLVAPVISRLSPTHTSPIDPITLPTHPPRRMRVPPEFFTRPAGTASVSLGRGSGSAVARNLASYNMPAPQSSHARDGTTPEASIPDLREALSTLESKMASLMNERERLERSLEQAVRLQAPIQRLPSELLASIFTIGVHGAGEEDTLMLSNIVLVCRYWADVAMNTPVLWSHVAVSNHVSLDKARRRLSRSKSVPIHVDINFSPQMDGRGGTTEAIILAMDILYPSIWRWKSFQLSVPTRPQAHAALSRCKEKAPMLQIFQVRVFNSMQDDHYSPPPLPLFDGHFPRLSVCSFNSFNFGWDLSMVRGLRVLELGGYWNDFAPAVNVILDILRASPQLEELSLRNMSDVDPETCTMYEHEPHLENRFPSYMIQLPRLTKMTFHYAGIQRTRTILSQIAFPALEKVALCYMDNVTTLLNHLKRQSLTSLPLQHLRIEASFFGELELVRLLSRTSSLTTLELVDVEDASSSLIRVRARKPPTSSCFSDLFSRAFLLPRQLRRGSVPNWKR